MLGLDVSIQMLGAWLSGAVQGPVAMLQNVDLLFKAALPFTTGLLEGGLSTHQCLAHSDGSVCMDALLHWFLPMLIPPMPT